MSNIPEILPIHWYRTPLLPEVLRELHERSDFSGLVQVLGFLGVWATTGGTALYAAGHWPVPVTVLIVFLHGMVTAFMINGVHELGHGTVFKTRALNAFFDRVLAFLGWINFEMFEASHARHHRYTLHPPGDLEVVLPIRIMVKNFFQSAFLNPVGAWQTIRDTLRIARNQLKDGWETTLFPPTAPRDRRRPVRWARTLLIGHGLIIAVSIYTRHWLVPVLVTFAPFYGGWLFFFCNNTQHIGLQDNVPDFRRSCRTFTLNPIVRFLYWQMNYHTEHHMYAAVPCYKLAKLHHLIKHDLPPCPAGLVATWREIAAIQRVQKTNPAYQHIAALPNGPVLSGN